MFELRQLPDSEKPTLLAEIRRVADVVGGQRLTVSAFRKHARVAITTLRRHFGSWRGALAAAGLDHLYTPIPPARKSRTASRHLTRDAALAEIRRVARELGTTSLTTELFRVHSPFGLDAVRNRFGSWRDALAAAGLSETNGGVRYSDEQCHENLLTVWTHYGRPPKNSEMKLPPSRLGSKAYIRRWGTWRKALAAFVERMEGLDRSTQPGVPLEESASPLMPAPVAQRVLPEDRHDISLGLRYRVLKRDGFRCVTCGRSPATAFGIELHVDHTVAFSKGGKTVESNLRTLCLECNLGKGAHH